MDVRALIWQGSTAWKASAEERHLSYEEASCQRAHGGAAARSNPGRWRSATAYRLLYARAAPPPVPLPPTCHTHCAGYLSPGQAVQPCAMKFMTFVSSESTVDISDHV